jgi:hypothetical protein
MGIISFLLILFGLIVIPSSLAQTADYLIIRKIEKNKITYEKYNASGQESVDISNLILWDQIEAKGEIFNIFYYQITDLRVLLLEKGYAKIKDTTNASIEEISAQKRAVSSKIGIWGKSEDRQKKPSEQTEKEVKNFFGTLWEIMIALSSIGLLSWIVTSLYKKFYVQRSVRLLLIGDPSAGKTALLKTLINTRMSKETLREEILSLEPSRGVTKIKRTAVIPAGKFEIVPEVSDIAGSAHSTVWDTFRKSRNHAVVFVVSPLKINGVQDGTVKTFDINTDTDQRYMDVQLGSLTFAVGGIGAKSTKKPKILILFISKFDLYSKDSPTDSSSRKIREKMLDIFKEHINSAESAAKKVGIRFKLILGSSAEQWNTKEVLDTIIDVLYDKL